MSLPETAEGLTVLTALGCKASEVPGCAVVALDEANQRPAAHRAPVFVVSASAPLFVGVSSVFQKRPFLRWLGSELSPEPGQACR